MKKAMMYHIDGFQNRETDYERFVVILGWAFRLDALPLEYDLYVNGTKTDYEMVVMKRGDVLHRYPDKAKDLKCGFRIKAKLKEKAKKIELIARSEKGEHHILLLNERKLNKLMDHSTIEFSIDSSEGGRKESDAHLVNIIGWAYSLAKKPISFRVYSKKRGEVECTWEATKREDLCKIKLVGPDEKYCGFKLKFEGKFDDKDPYTIELSDGVTKRKFPLNDTSKRDVNYFKYYLSILSIGIIQRGFKYMRNYGVKGFINRLLDGPFADDIRYTEWFELTKVTEAQLEDQRNTHFEYNPKISIIVPTYNTPLDFLIEMIDSVRNQSYSNWELCIADGSTNSTVKDYVTELQSTDDRIKLKLLDKNYGISGNTNEALALATGDYVGLFDHDDLLTLDCLFEVVKSLQEVHHDIIYTDEDKLDNKAKKFVDPNFKPDFSIDLFRSHNYITHFFVVKSEIIKGVGGFRSEFDGSQDYDLMFRCIEKSQSIYHVPKILYHWRMHSLSTAEDPESKMYCYEAGKHAIEDHYRRLGIDAKVEMMKKPLYGMYHTIYSTKDNPLVSVIIPNKDQKETLKTCIDSLYKVNKYKNIEIIIVENNSTTQEIFDYYDQLQKDHDNIKVVKWEKEFNYSLINNYGVTFAKGNYLLFLNNDTKMINPASISEMLGCCMREEVGIVGAKLLYEDDTIQHAGVIIGFSRYAGHIYNGLDKDDRGFMMRAVINCNYSAVTAACMMVKRECFEAVDGFSPEFVVACNDIDLCLKIRELGKLVVYNAFSLWYHYESKTRGYEDDEAKAQRFEDEKARFGERWSKILDEGDPYYNKNWNIKLGPFKLL